MALADEALGEPTTPRRVRSTAAGDVFELIAGDGRRWFGKRFRLAHRYRAELMAYRRWVPALGDRAPSLVAADDDTRLLLMTALPGEPVVRPSDRQLLAAGRLLRSYHGAMPRRSDCVAAVVAAQLERQLVRSRRADVRLDEGWVRRQVAVVADLGPLPVVASHGDFLPRNWLSDASGGVRVVDFAESRPFPAAHDIARLALSCWDRPGGLDALLLGYGRRLDDAETSFVDAQLTLSAVAALTWATRHGAPRKRARAEAVLAAQRDGFRFQPPHH